MMLSDRLFSLLRSMEPRKLLGYNTATEGFSKMVFLKYSFRERLSRI
nr:hypothetical protein Iba_chr11eCG8200 [Ipomoea batatas]GMD58805.1 hypothetical protein Iba_chr11fCG9120 [Ipomoea batatas]